MRQHLAKSTKDTHKRWRLSNQTLISELESVILSLLLFRDFILVILYKPSTKHLIVERRSNVVCKKMARLLAGMASTWNLEEHSRFR